MADSSSGDSEGDGAAAFRKRLFRFIWAHSDALSIYMGGISTDNFYQWERGLRPIPALRARQIDEFSNGLYSRHRLRPDIFGPPPWRGA